MTALFYRKRPVIVKAVRVRQSQLVRTAVGMVHAKPGDWLITGHDGKQWPVADAVFRRTYEECEPAGVVS